MKNKKEIIHMGNDNRCDTCYQDGYNKAIKKVLEKIDNRFNETNEIDKSDWEELKQQIGGEK